MSKRRRDGAVLKYHKATGEWVPHDYVYYDGYGWLRKDELRVAVNYGVLDGMWEPWLDPQTMNAVDGSNYGCVTMLRTAGRFGRAWGDIVVAPLARKGRKNNVNAFLRLVHRHCGPVTGWSDAIAIRDGICVFGLLLLSYPKARGIDDGETLEVNRLALMSGTPKNIASQLLGRAERIAKAKGFTRLISYTLASEEGVSYSAAGWPLDDHRTTSRQWATPSRRRNLLDEGLPIMEQDKLRWSKILRRV